MIWLFLTLVIVGNVLLTALLNKLLTLPHAFFTWPTFVNTTHKKIDAGIRVIGIVIVFIAFILFARDDTTIMPLSIPIMVFTILFLSESTRIFFYYRHNKPRYALRACFQMLYFFIVITSFIIYLNV